MKTEDVLCNNSVISRKDRVLHEKASPLIFFSSVRIVTINDYFDSFSSGSRL